MIKQHTGLPVNDLRIVWLRPDGSYQEFDLEYQEDVVRNMLCETEWAFEERERREEAVEQARLRYDLAQTKKFINDDKIGNVARQTQEEILRKMTDKQDLKDIATKILRSDAAIGGFSGMVYNNLLRNGVDVTEENIERFVEDAVRVRAVTQNKLKEYKDG
jgi:hypothetical protein